MNARSTLVLCLCVASCRMGEGDPWAELHEQAAVEPPSADDDEETGNAPVRDDEVSNASDDDDAVGSDSTQQDESTSEVLDDESEPETFEDESIESDDVTEDEVTPDTADDELTSDSDDESGPTTEEDSTDETAPPNATETQDAGQAPEVTDPAPSLDAGQNTEPPPCLPTDDWEECDQQDNNCDGQIDEGYVCPAPAGVVGAVAFEGGVYSEGTTVPGLAGATALQRFWPEMADSYLNGFGYYDGNFLVRRTDNQLFFYGSDGLYGRRDGLLPTTCDSYRISQFDFDVEETLYYLCPNELRRGDESIAERVEALLGVTDDGRAVAVHMDSGLGHWQEGNGFAAADLVVFGTRRYLAASVQGDVIVVAFERQLVGSEVFVVKFDAGSTWSVMRRVPVTSVDGLWDVLVDGTLFVHENDPAGSDARIRAILPDGTEQVAWREEAEAAVQFHGQRYLFTGPLDPALIEAGGNEAQ